MNSLQLFSVCWTLSHIPICVTGVNHTLLPIYVTILPPGGIDIVLDTTYQININYTNLYNQVEAELDTEQDDILDITKDTTLLNMTSGATYQAFLARGIQIGHAYIIPHFSHLNGTMITGVPDHSSYRISVVRSSNDLLLQEIFTYLLSVLLVLTTFMMGCKILVKTIVKCLKKPYAVLIGLASQFLIMPLLSFAYANAFFLTDIQVLGLLTVGCAPGGGMSNSFCVLQDADLDLSVTMTTISLVAAMGLMPLWLTAFGQFFPSMQLAIPYQNIAITLSLMIVPLGLGMLMRHLKPSWADKILKPLRPICLVVVIGALGLGIYQAQYIFDLFTWQIACSTVLLPTSGFLVGGLLAVIFSRPFRQIKAIAMETGIQNTALAITLIKYSLTQPNVDLAMMMPSCIAGATIFFMLLLSLVHVIMMKISPKYRKLHDNTAEGITDEKKLYSISPSESPQQMRKQTAAPQQMEKQPEPEHNFSLESYPIELGSSPEKHHKTESVSKVLKDDKPND